MNLEIPEQYKQYFPTEWNGHKVSYDGVNLVVDNFQDTDEFKSMKFHNSILALGFKGIGPATSEKLYEAGIRIKDLFQLTPPEMRNKLIESNIFQSGRSLDNLIDSIYNLNKVELWEIIYSTGYRNLGRTVSKQLANWMVKIKHDFAGLEKQVVEDFIYDNERISEVKELTNLIIQANVEVVKPEELSNDIITYEMSGDATGYGSKGEFRKIVEASGKCIKTSLKKDTDYLVVASTALETTKTKKAIKNGTKLITYSDFEELIKSL